MSSEELIPKYHRLFNGADSFHHSGSPLLKFIDVVTIKERPPSKDYQPLLKPLVRNGRIVRDFKEIDGLKERTSRMVERVSSVEEPVILGD